MLRIGRIPYANLFPLYYHLQCMAERGTREYGFIDGVPSEVNRLLREGLIDVGPSSSIEYLRSPGRYMTVDGHSVSSEGEVGSILLFSRAPLETLDGTTILYSSQSETSAALLGIILSRFYGLHCDTQQSGLPLLDGLRGHPAYLLIGDDALLEARRRQGLHVYDLGEIWYRHTGLPFVYALWTADRGIAGRIDAFAADLDRAREEALRDLPAVARACPCRKWLSERDLLDYWGKLSYDFNDRHRRGLELFSRYLREDGVL